VRDRHKTTPISLRPPADLRAWLESYAELEGRAVRAVIIDALNAYRSTVAPCRSKGTSTGSRSTSVPATASGAWLHRD